MVDFYKMVNEDDESIDSFLSEDERSDIEEKEMANIVFAMMGLQLIEIVKFE